MRKTEDLQSALRSEFVCYYNGDVLNFVHDEAFRKSMPQRAWDSAHRLRHVIVDDKLEELINDLESLKANPYGQQMCNLMEASQTWWADDPQDWAVFQELVDLIIKHLKQDPPIPRPA